MISNVNQIVGNITIYNN